MPRKGFDLIEVRTHWQTFVKPYGQPLESFASIRGRMLAIKDMVIEDLTKRKVLHCDISLRNLVLEEELIGYEWKDMAQPTSTLNLVRWKAKPPDRKKSMGSRNPHDSLKTTGTIVGKEPGGLGGKEGYEELSETLQFTNIKLAELRKRNDKFVQHESQVQEKANACTDAITHLQEHVEGLKQWPAARTANIDLIDIKRSIEQAWHVSTFPPLVIDEWTRRAEAQSSFRNTRSDFAQQFGTLLNEQLQSKSPSAESTEVSMEDDFVEQTLSPMGFEKNVHKETIERKEKLEPLIFEKKEVYVKASNAYLVNTPSSIEILDELEKIREWIKKLSKKLRERSITLTEFKQAIQSVLQTDAYSERQATLKELLRNQTVMKELARVLNMQLLMIRSWSRPSTGVLLESCLHLNGRTRFHLDMEILSLLHHYPQGLRSIKFKKNLEQLFKSRTWRRSGVKGACVDRKHQNVFFDKGRQDHGIKKRRQEYQRVHFFRCQILTEHEVMKINCKEDVDEDCNGFTKDKQNPELRVGSPVDLKQSLPRNFFVDVTMNKALHGWCAVMRSDLEWVPNSYLLSMLFGELVLFVVDFTVNQKSDGLFLRRIHNDFWFRDILSLRCVTVHMGIRRYTKVAGLSFNVENTGSVAIRNDAPHKGLPKGDVQWGFLCMNNEQWYQQFK